MDSVLVSGGAGFIGSNFVRMLLHRNAGVRVVNLDLLTYAGSLRNLEDLSAPARHVFVHGDICDQPMVEELIRRHEIRTVVHFAAESHVDRSIHGPAAFVQTNVLGTFSLLEAARRCWTGAAASDLSTRRFHHVSTDEVYGSLGPQDPAFTESTPYDPSSPYSASKAGSDHLVRAYHHTFGLPCTISNCSNNYGPYQFPEKLIPVILVNCLRGRSLPVYGDGRQVRDWLYVDDHCDAILQILERGQVGRTYNIGGDNQPTNIEIVRTICRLLDELRPDSPHCPHEQLISHVPDRPGHDRRYAMDITRISTELGWRPQISLEQGLRRTVEWYLKSAEWLSAVTGEAGYAEWMSTHYATSRAGPSQSEAD